MPSQVNAKSMPKIKEAENEDKDGSNDKKSKNVRQGKSTHARTNPPGFLDNIEGDAAYSTFQKDSEPGNRQGDEAPCIGKQFYTSPQSYNRGASDDQMSQQQVQMMATQKTPINTGKQSIAMEGSSFEEYHRQESSEMQDI